MSIITPRESYAPVEYPQAKIYCRQQQKAHWLPDEVKMNADVNDWKFNLTDNERSVIAHILKGFTQTEVFIEDFWATKVSKWFRKPEIQAMAHTFASMEVVHAEAYALLNETLGLDDFGSYVHDPSTKAKIDRLITAPGKTKEEIARALAVFSAFNEGVNLFSSFAILLNFKRFNKLKGVGNIVEWSIKDESLHSEAGCWLFRQFISEFPEIWTDELKKDIYDAARHTVQLEDAYIDQAFANGPIEGIDASDLKAYIRFRANTKLNDLTLKMNWKNIDMEAVARITSWFDLLSSGVQHTDFFATKPTDYSRAVIFDESIWS